MFVFKMNTVKVFSLLCTIALLFQVNALASSFCDDAPVSKSVTPHHTCCISSQNTVYHETAEQCESCSSCLACEQEQKISENNSVPTRMIEQIGTLTTAFMLPFERIDISVVNDKNLDLNLFSKFQLPPSSPVLLL
ncbi:hypothetical protein QA601_07825 [Chitinispirillales bacterium ANBcel5]|uniref:hypothetical protein n=1 Tax=Cellulosispirillum alkaliphilum TaxID=3039283 RepID=UPI002A528808|nr:hypothetical protein [Chitinispirillales bacterium ANBcel5]